MNGKLLVRRKASLACWEWLRVHDLAKGYAEPSRANLSHAEEIGRIIVPLMRHYIFHP